MTEQWKPVKCYEGIYEVSDLGRIKRVGKTRSRSHRLINKGMGRILHQPKVVGYPVVVLFDAKGDRVMKKVHRLVAEAFIPIVSGKLQVNHLDGNRSNNLPANLEWCTPSENKLHAFATGLTKLHNQGERHPLSTLSSSDVKKIVRLRDKKTQQAIAREFNICQAHVSDIQTGKSWRHLGISTHQPRDRCQIGESNYASKLTEEQVKIAWHLKGKTSQTKIAQRFGVSRKAISLIHYSKTWMHITRSLAVMPVMVNHTP